VNQVQVNEKWHALLRSGNTVIATSNDTPDLEDRVAVATFAGVVNEGILLSQDVDNFVAEHGQGYGSLYTVCAAFDELAACPFQATADRTVVYFDASLGVAASQSSPIDVDLSSGTYKVSLYSQDGFKGRVFESENDETWKVDFRNSSGNSIITSNKITDLADGFDSATLNQIVDEALSIPGSVESVVALHGSSNPANNNFTAVCAAFESAGTLVSACSNGIDDDGDGLIDMADPGCSSPSDNNEFNVPTQCSNGIDDDGDGLIDMADPGCSSPSDNDEFNVLAACEDGIDNDGDGLIDMADPGCSSPSDNDETDPENFSINSSGSLFVTFVGSETTAQSSRITLTISPTFGFSNNVTLSVVNFGGISGATPLFSKNNISLGEFAEGVLFSMIVPSTAPEGATTITIEATDGNIIRTIQKTLNVEKVNPTFRII